MMISLKFEITLQWYQAIGKTIISYVKARMIGRLADLQDGTLKMLMAVALSGHGDHLEIGTLFGGSAIAAVLMKKMMELSGNVICLDPLDGYYRNSSIEADVDPITKLPVNLETVLENARRFSVSDRLEIITQRSYPWPVELEKRSFASAYIDGDHWNFPWLDWLNVKDRVSRFIIFDNCDLEHPDVMFACQKAEQDRNWRRVHSEGITFILERVNDLE